MNKRNCELKEILNLFINTIIEHKLTNGEVHQILSDLFSLHEESEKENNQFGTAVMD